MWNWRSRIFFPGENAPVALIWAKLISTTNVCTAEALGIMFRKSDNADIYVAHCSLLISEYITQRPCPNPSVIVNCNRQYLQSNNIQQRHIATVPVTVHVIRGIHANNFWISPEQLLLLRTTKRYAVQFVHTLMMTSRVNLLEFVVGGKWFVS